MCVYNVIRAKMFVVHRRASFEKRKKEWPLAEVGPTAPTAPGIKTEAQNLEVTSCTTTRNSNQHAGITV
jgi:hypothetical protein